jgi:hypothetical protein
MPIHEGALDSTAIQALIGLKATDPIGFYGATPVVQRSSSNQTTSNVVTSASYGTLQVAQMQEVLNILNGLGLSKGS